MDINLIKKTLYRSFNKMVSDLALQCDVLISPIYCAIFHSLRAVLTLIGIVT
jgi:hypothetical protein